MKAISFKIGGLSTCLRNPAFPDYLAHCRECHSPQRNSCIPPGTHRLPSQDDPGGSDSLACDNKSGDDDSVC